MRRGAVLFTGALAAAWTAARARPAERPGPIASRIRFEEVARQAGLDFVLENCPTPRKHLIETMPGGVAAFDYDGDGRPDVFFANGASVPGLRKDDPRYANRLFRNRGAMKFVDVSGRSGIARRKGRGMAVAFADYDQDGLTDVYVTEDALPSALFHNRGDGTFEETALLAGASVPEHGKDVSAMGVDFRDYDNDGRPDIAVTALAGESFPLYRNLGRGAFQDVTHASRLGPLVATRSGWGNGLVDF